MEGLGDKARLVALQRTDEVPLEMWKSNFADLVRAFLHVIFTKCHLPGPSGLQNAGGWPGLADGQKPDFLRRPPAIVRSVADTRENGLQVGGNCCHNQFGLESLESIALP